MTRFLIAALLVLNAATLAWQWDGFARWGFGPNTAREPERLVQQIRPEAIQMETPEAKAQRLATPQATSADDTAPTEPAAPVATPNGR